MAQLANRVKFTTSTTGTGSITGFVVASGEWFRLPTSAAGVVDGIAYSYAIIDGTAGEVGRGVFSGSGTTMTRTVVESSNSNNAISLSGAATVFITDLDIDHRSLGKSRASAMNQHLR